MDAIRLYDNEDRPESWINRDGKEVPLTKLDNASLILILDKLHTLALIKQEMQAGLYEGFKGAYFQHTAKQIKDADWHDFADKVFFDLEYEAAVRKLGWSPKPLPTEKQINLLQRGALERYLVGALRDAINSHGPITKNLAPSAAKRMIGAIKTFNHDTRKIP